jgi:hypothetical protein
MTDIPEVSLSSTDLPSPSRGITSYSSDISNLAYSSYCTA